MPTPPTSEAQVVTDDGIVQGIPGQSVHTFAGIRYAKPPTGDNRFLPPQPLGADEVTTDATQFGDRNFQLEVVDIFLGDRETPGGESEDCLFLNVYTPADMDGDKPVLVWIHGGAFRNGSGNEYDVTEFVEAHDVVVVTINYRLGIFGFLDLRRFGPEYSQSVNLGIQDQIAALDWVSNNISAFGGDPANVTIFGQSAGGNSVFSLLAAPAAEGLFDKAMALSGGEVLHPPGDHIAPIQAFLGVETEDEVLERLKSMAAEELVALQLDTGFQPGTFIDGSVIAQRPSEAVQDGWASEIPIVTGTTLDEGTILGPAFAVTEEIGAIVLFALATDVVGGADPSEYLAYLEQSLPDANIEERLSRVWFDVFRSSALRIAAHASQSGAGGWVYNFEVPTDHPFGISHGADLPFIFRWIEPDHPGLLFHEPTAANQELAVQWSATLASFARTGSPNGAGLPQWDQFQPGSYSSMRIAETSEIVDGWDADLLEIYAVP